MPVLAASYPVDRTDFVPIAYAGRVGVWVSEDALGDMLAGFERDKGALRVEIAKAHIGEQLAADRAAAIEHNAKEMAWAAKFGPWLAFAAGVGLTLAVTLGAVYAGKTLALQPALGGLTYGQ